MAEVIVLGIDPGTRCTGYGVVREVSGQAVLVAAGAIRPPAKAAMARRLGEIYKGIARVIEQYGPHEVAMEEVFTHKNVSSALKLGQARGAAMAACAVHGLEVRGYNPMAVKKSIVGTGRADKNQVAYMVAQVLGTKARQECESWPADVTDALAMAVCHLNSRRLARLTEAAGGMR